MKKVDLLVQRYLDFFAAADALLFVDDGIVTSCFDAVSNRNQIQVSVDCLTSLAHEAGMEMTAAPFPYGSAHDTEYSVIYNGVTIYDLGNRNGTS